MVKCLKQVAQRSSVYSIPERVLGQVGWGFGQPDLINVSVHSRRLQLGDLWVFFPTQTFYDSNYWKEGGQKTLAQKSHVNSPPGILCCSCFLTWRSYESKLCSAVICLWASFFILFFFSGFFFPPFPFCIHAMFFTSFSIYWLEPSFFCSVFMPFSASYQVIFGYLWLTLSAYLWFLICYNGYPCLWQSKLKSRDRVEHC